MGRRPALCLDSLDRAARALLVSRRALVLSGAGMSVESGIPDFRSPSGLWRTYPVDEYATLSAFRRDPEKVWGMLRAMVGLLASAEPNAGHQSLAALERAGHIARVITQNIDGLHRRAGSQAPLEVHGSYLGLHCPTCGHRDGNAEAPATGVPTCPRCGGPTKPPVVLFEEGLPPAMGEALRLTASCDCMVVVGTSLAVQPVASLPSLAAGHGASLVEVNLEPGHLRRFGAIELCGGAATVLPLLAERVRELG